MRSPDTANSPLSLGQRGNGTNQQKPLDPHGTNPEKLPRAVPTRM
jgi:hypothetical protein